MRILISILFVFVLLGCSPSKKPLQTLNTLNGIWIPLKQEIGGNELPSSFFNSQRLEIIDSNYVLKAESIDKGIVRYNNGKMDIYGKEGVNANKHFTCIYKIENNILTVCYNLIGDSYPIEFETKSKPTLFISVFKKE